MTEVEIFRAGVKGALLLFGGFFLSAAGLLGFLAVTFGCYPHCSFWSGVLVVVCVLVGFAGVFLMDSAKGPADLGLKDE